ncbi:MAG: hypothetical protein NTU73_09920, partial [Ignavibacteriae bacterium]|nr:hypothetical protein [Ignavibacteriota bacterium]
MKKITIMLFLMFLFIGFSHAQKNQNAAIEKYSQISYKIVMNGDAVTSICENRSVPSIKSILKFQSPSQNSLFLFSSTFTYIGCSTSYTTVSNSTPQNIYQDPNNPDRIHIVCISAPPEDSITFTNRKTKYYYSTDKGTTWSFICNVPDVRSGLPVITLTSNGNALIANYGGSPTRTSWYYDAAPGLGSFVTLTPATMDYIWPRTVATNSITLTNKFIGIGSPNGRDSAFTIIGQSLTSPGIFSQWQFINSDQAETYSIARGTDGRIGIVYHVNDVLFPNDYGSVFFMESTNNGTSYSTPLKIFNANISPTGDSLGALRGIQMVYQGNIPKVVFETIKQTNTSSYFPNAGKNNIRFWSTSLSGSDPNRSIVIADTLLVGYHPYKSYGIGNRIFACICRPTIGVSNDGTGLFAAFMVPINYYGSPYDTISYMDIWLTYSVNYGSNWDPPTRVNPVTPIKDWTYPSISPFNDNTANNYYVNLVMLSDSLPGSIYMYLNPKYTFARVEISRNPIIPAAPTLLSPINGASNVSLTPTLDWTDVSGVFNYRIQISSSPTFTSAIVDTIIQISQISIPSGKLSQFTTYYWRVNASNSAGSSPWSFIWNFTTTFTSAVNLYSNEVPT